MNMGMSFGFSMRQEQSQSMSLEQRMESAQRLGGKVLELSKALNLPTRSYEAMVTRTSEMVRDPMIRNGVYQTLNNRGVREAIIAIPHRTTIQNPERLRSLMADAVFRYHSGDFHGLLSPEDVVARGSDKLPFSVFLDACLKPEEVRSDIELIKRKHVSANEFAAMHISEKLFGLRMAEETAQEREVCQCFLSFALAKSDRKSEKDSVSPLARYSRELIFQREYLPVVVDRLLARITQAAIRNRNMQDNFERSLQLHVAEFVLVSLGIIAPGLVQRNDTAVVDEVLSDENLEEEALGFNLSEYFDKWGNSNQPFSINQELVEILDGARSKLITTFLNAAIRPHWEVIRSALGGYETLSGIMNEAKENKERSEALDNLVIDALSGEKFQGVIKAKIVKEWYQILDPFLARPLFTL